MKQDYRHEIIVFTMQFTQPSYAAVVASAANVGVPFYCRAVCLASFTWWAHQHRFEAHAVGSVSDIIVTDTGDDIVFAVSVDDDLYSKLAEQVFVERSSFADLGRSICWNHFQADLGLTSD